MLTAALIAQDAAADPLSSSPEYGAQGEELPNITPTPQPTRPPCDLELCRITYPTEEDRAEGRLTCAPCCPPGDQRVYRTDPEDPESGVCRCPDPDAQVVVQSGEFLFCRPPCPYPGQQYDTSLTCVCPAGQVLEVGACRPPCPPGQPRAGDGSCCPAGQIVNNAGACVCPPSTELVGSECLPVCPPGQPRAANGQCCPSGQIPVGAGCGCPPGTENVGGTCTELCPPGQPRAVNGACCPPPFSIGSNGLCGCPPGTEPFNGSCANVCPPGQPRAASGECCPGGQIPVNGTCGCPPGQELVGGSCTGVCPPGTIRKPDGSCGTLEICPGSEAYDGSGYCKEGKAFCFKNPFAIAGATGEKHYSPVYMGDDFPTKASFKNALLQGHGPDNKLRCYICGCFRLNGCFVPGVKIRMADGSDRAIEEIRAGDLIWNPATRAPVAVERVIEGTESEPLIRFGFDRETLTVTQKHPVPTARGLLQAHELTLGDLVYDQDGTAHEVTVLERVETEPRQRVINLRLESDSEEPESRMLLSDGIMTGDVILQLLLSHAKEAR